MSAMTTEERPWLHGDATPPQEWLRLLAVELLETKVSKEWLTAEWDSAAQDCSVPLVVTTGALRVRLRDYPDAFHKTMLRLGGRIAAALKDKLNFEWEDFGQALCEKATAELGECVPAPEPAIDEGPIGATAAPVADEVADVVADEPVIKQERDAVFARHGDAQKATLIDKGKQDLIRLAQSGKKGADGSLVANGWRPA
eukprot:7389409-Prymnesium_polylepis.1